MSHKWKLESVNEWIYSGLPAELLNPAMEACALIQKVHAVPSRNSLSLPSNPRSTVLVNIPFGGVNIEAFTGEHYGYYVSVRESIAQNYEHPGAYIYINTALKFPFFTCLHEFYHVMHQEFWSPDVPSEIILEQGENTLGEDFLKLQRQLMRMRRVRKSNANWLKLVLRHELIDFRRRRMPNSISDEDFRISELTCASAKYLASPEEWMARAYSQAVTFGSRIAVHRIALRKTYETQCFSSPSNLSRFGVWWFKVLLLRFIRRIGWNA